jgi:hypothetical protein
MKMWACFLLPLMLFAATAQDQNKDQISVQKIDGKILFINTATNGIMIQVGSFSQEFVFTPKTSMSSGNQAIGFRNLMAGQSVEIVYMASNYQNELVSINVTNPIVKNPDPSGKEQVQLSGKITMIEPFSRLVLLNAGSRSYQLQVSQSTSVMLYGKQGAFTDLKTGQLVKIVAVKVGDQIAPISITVQ